MNSYAITHAKLWIGDGTAYDGHVVVGGGRIEKVAPGPYRGELEAMDAAGAPLSPGLVDLMVLGGFDRSILRDDPLDITREYLRLGVTTCQLCSGTLPWESLRRVTENTRRTRAYTGTDAARLIGYYLEGPFQHPDLTGASLREHALPPSRENVRRVIDELGDAVTLINVSPGTEGDTAAIRELCAAGKIVSMAHSDAPAERVFECLEAGTTVLGHFWNNHHGALTEPGVQRATLEHVALTDERVRFIHLVCDGTHVHPVNVRLLNRARGVEAICLVTDCVPRAGRPDGPYVWDDGRPFYKKGGVGRTDKHNLTGSALLLPDHFRNFVRFTRARPEAAIRTVTHNPARSLGLDHRFGLLAPGRSADLVLWDDELRIRRVWRGGDEVPNVSDYAEVQMEETSAAGG